MKFYYFIVILFSIILSSDNSYGLLSYGLPLNNNVQTSSMNESSKIELSDNLILFKSIDPKTYIVGPGDIFLFNMIIPNRVINVELLSSPSSTILIPGIGLIDVKGATLDETYTKIIDACKKIHEDAYVYVNIIRLRKFSVLVSGNSRYARMYDVYATYRVSDLIEHSRDITNFNATSNFNNSILKQYNSYRPKNAMIGKKLELLRGDEIIGVDLFNFYLNGDFSGNPILMEGDIIRISNSSEVAIIGEVNAPKIKSDFNNMTYNDMIVYAQGLKNEADLDNIMILNEKMLSSYDNQHTQMITSTESQYRSDFDESYLRSRRRTIEGIVNIQDREHLSSFLNTKVSPGDIIIVPPKVEFIELIGGIKNPGTYKYNSDYSLSDYIDLAGNFTINAKTKHIYLVDLISGNRTKLNMSYKIKRGDVIFVQEELEYKSWDRIKEQIQLGGTLTSLLLLIYNIFESD